MDMRSRRQKIGCIVYCNCKCHRHTRRSLFDLIKFTFGRFLFDVYGCGIIVVVLYGHYILLVLRANTHMCILYTFLIHITHVCLKYVSRTCLLMRAYMYVYYMCNQNHTIRI